MFGLILRRRPRRLETWELKVATIDPAYRQQLMDEYHALHAHALTPGMVVEYLKLDATMARRVWKPAMTHVALEQALVKDMEILAQWQLDTGQVTAPKPPNALELIHFGSLAAVAPKRVTIIH